MASFKNHPEAAQQAAGTHHHAPRGASASRTDRAARVLGPSVQPSHQYSQSLSPQDARRPRAPRTPSSTRPVRETSRDTLGHRSHPTMAGRQQRPRRQPVFDDLRSRYRQDAERPVLPPAPQPQVTVHQRRRRGFRHMARGLMRRIRSAMRAPVSAAPQIPTITVTDADADANEATSMRASASAAPQIPTIIAVDTDADEATHAANRERVGRRETTGPCRDLREAHHHLLRSFDQLNSDSIVLQARIATLERAAAARTAQAGYFQQHVEGMLARERRQRDELAQQNTDLLLRNNNLVQQNNNLAQQNNTLVQQNNTLVQDNNNLRRRVAGLAARLEALVPGSS